MRYLRHSKGELKTFGFFRLRRCRPIPAVAAFTTAQGGGERSGLDRPYLAGSTPLRFNGHYLPSGACLE